MLPGYISSQEAGGPMCPPAVQRRARAAHVGACGVVRSGSRAVFSHVFFPPRAPGQNVSTVVATPPQYPQRCPSRAMTPGRDHDGPPV